MDRILNAKSIKSILLVSVIVVNSVYGTENIEQSIHGSDSITNGTESSHNGTENVPEISSPKVLSRRKRYVAFPEGSSFSVRVLLSYFMFNCLQWHFFNSNVNE